MNTKNSNSSAKSDSPIHVNGPEIPKIMLALLAAIAWPAISLFGVSALLCIGAVLVTASATFLFFAAGMLNLRHKTIIRTLLFATIVLSALVGTLSFQLQLIRFFVVDWTVLALYLSALAFGLWTVMLTWQRLMASFIAMMLIVAPFTPDIDRNEKWSISLTVVNEVCEPVPLASAVCEAVAVESLKNFVVKGHTGISVTDDKGAANFEVTGNPLLKGAVCGSFRIGTDASTDPTFPPRTVLVPAPFISKAKAQIQLSRNDAVNVAQGCEERE